MEIRITESSGQPKREYRKKLSDILLETALIGLTTGAGLWITIQMLTERGDSIPLSVSVILTSFLCITTGRMKQYGSYIRGTAFFACVVGILLLHRQILNGFVLCWNDAADILGRRAGIYISRFDTTGIADAEMMRWIFFVYLGILAAVLGFLILKFRLYLLLFAESLAVPAIMILTETEPDRVVSIAFYIGIFLEMNFLLGNTGKKRYSIQSSLAFWFGTALAVMTVFVAVILLEQIMPQAEYTSSRLVVEARKEALDGINNLRYKKGKINSLPDGQLKKCGAWTASDDTALQVTMKNPESLYLRGFTGSVYDGSSWKSIDTEEAYKQKNLFYWLHQNGFYGETQLNLARSFVKDDQLSSEISDIEINNRKADSRYLYTPYEMTGLPAGYQRETPFADSMLKAKGVFGQRSYQLQTNGNLVKDFTVLGARIYQTLVAGDAVDYRDEESYYNAFVYSQDTVLPASLENLFREELGDGGNREQGHTDYYTAISRIRAYFEKNMTYSAATDVVSGEGDFTQNFLTETKIGHSIHYATAAALMFRYYGIPSRYVEGYLITPEDVRGRKPGDTIDISGKNGHAWTEIYIDGLGWVPIEMTPEYEGVMEEADLVAGLEAKGAKSAVIPPAEEEAPAEENIQTHWSLKLALFGIEKFLILFLTLFDIFCLIFILSVCILRIYENMKRRKLFASPDDRLAVKAMAGYAGILYLHGADRYSVKIQKQYREIRSIGQKAAFSQHTISKKERDYTEAGMKEMKEELQKAKSWYENWIMKYIERLY